MTRSLAALVLAAAVAPAHALDCFGALGGWSYDLSGTVVNGGDPLDVERDLGLQTTAKKQYALGCTPAAPGWVPAFTADYVRIGARGAQAVPATRLFGAVTLSPASTARSTTEVNDFQLALRWRWPLGPVNLLGGATLKLLDGTVTVADAASGDSQTNEVNQPFPLLSLGAQWSPVARLHLSLTGDYIRYDGDQAHEIEALLRWQALGPVALEAGWRQRRYAFSDGDFAFDTTLDGLRLGVRMDFPVGP